MGVEIVQRNSVTLANTGKAALVIHFQKMSKSFILFTAIAAMATTMADPLVTPTCSHDGTPSAPGVSCEGSNVIGIDWIDRGLTGNIKVLANLKHLETLYLLFYNFK